MGGPMVQVLLGTLISGRKLFSPNEKSDSDSADPEKGSSSTKENGDTQEGDVATTDADADGTPTTQGGAKHDARKHRDKGAVHRWSPAFAGMCCPFSILLEIPGLTDRWYIRTTGSGGGGKVIETQPNSALLDTALAVSISFAALANVALICRFLERKPRLSTIVTIISLTFHDIINIVVVTVFGIVHSKSDGFTYSQSFFMTVASSTISSVCNITLITDFIWVDNFKEKGSGLTTKQRSLVISCMALLCYLALGSLVFSLINSPRLTFQDALYFTIVTVATIGYGDIVPDTLSSKIFLFPFETVGIVLLTVTIAMARETIIESFEASYRSRREAVLKRTKERREQKRKARNARRARSHTIAGNHETPTPALARMPTVLPNAGEEIHDDDSIIEVSWWRRALHKVTVLVARLRHRDPPPHPAVQLQMARTITQRSVQEEDSLQKFKHRLEQEQRREFWTKLTVAGILFGAFWLVGAAVFTKTDSWTYFDALYFCFVTFISLGYGDFSPQTPAGRGFFIAWALFGIATMTILLSVLIEGWKSRYSTAINASKSGITIADRMRKLQLRKKAAEQARPDGAAAAAATTEGSPAVPKALAEPEEDDRDLATKLMENAKGFSRHAQFWMNQKSGAPPEELQRLMDETDELDGQADMQELRAIAQSAPEGSRQDLLFVISYARSFELLIDSAEQAVEVLRERERELEHLRVLTGHLEGVLENAKAADSPKQPASSEASRSFRKPTRLQTLFSGRKGHEDPSGSSPLRKPTPQAFESDSVLSEEPEGADDDLYSPSITGKDFAYGEPSLDGDSIKESDSPHRAAYRSAVDALSKYGDSNSSRAPSVRESTTTRPHHHRLVNVARAVAWMRHPHHHDAPSEAKRGKARVDLTPTASRPQTPLPTPGLDARPRTPLPTPGLDARPQMPLPATPGEDARPQTPTLSFQEPNEKELGKE